MSLQIETQPFQFNSTVTGLSSAVFNSVSAVSLSGTHYGDGSKLSGITATVTAVSGTVNQINASKSDTTVTLSFPNSAVFPGNVTILGNLSAQGTATFANTVFTTTSALSAVSNSTGPALYIGQLGTGDIASFYDLNPTPVEVLHIGGSVGIPGVGIYTSTPNKELTVVGEISATSVVYAVNGNSNQWNTAYQSISSQPYTFISSSSSIDTVNGNNIATGIFSGVLGGNCNTASGNYSTVVNGFSSCATGYSTFVGAGSGNRATGNYSIVGGGLRNTASCNNSTVGGGSGNCATQVNTTVGGGTGNTASGAYSTIAGGRNNLATVQNTTVGGGFGNSASGYTSTIAGGCGNKVCSTVFNNPNNSFIGGGNTNITFGLNSVIAGGCCNVICGIANSNILGGCGNLNPLRDSVIGGGVANHTGGYAPFNITAAASISGNGTQTCLIGTGIQSCFSSPFTTGNVSVYYSTPSAPLSAGTFTTATIAATGTNYIIINGDYSTCTGTSLSATSIYVYDRAISNTGFVNTIAGGKLNTASGCYSFVGGGICNAILSTGATACGNLIVGGFNNCIITNQFANTLVGGQNNCLGGGQRGFIGGGINNRITGASNQNVIVAGGGNTISGTYGTIVAGNANCIAASCVGFIGAGCSNTVSANAALVVGGRSNTTSSAYSSIVGGKFNYNPLFNSNIEGGSFNHTGGYAPANITFGANLSGNGTQTALIQSGIGSCFSASSTTGAVSLMWMTSGTANQALSSACFVTANVVTNAANCIIINGDYSTCTGTGLSACNIWVFDRCLNQGGCFNFIGGGVLNTASGCYSTIGGGARNVASCFYTTVGGGFNNTANCNYSTVAGGQCNTASGTYSFVGGGITNNAGPRSVVAGGRSNTASAYYGAIVAGTNNCICNINNNPNNSFIGAGARNFVQNRWGAVVGGCCNNVSGCWGVIGGGYLNTASGMYSFVAGGSANDTKGFANTFILGTGLSASQVNYTYVNNISAQSTISAPSISAVTFYGDGSKLTGITSSGGSGLYLPLSGGTMTGGLSAPSLSANNFYGSGSETILSDGLSANNTGQGTNTLSLNFTNGIYIGGNGLLNATTVNANNVTNYFYLTANGPSITTITNFFSSPGTSSSLIDTLSANSVYDIEYHLLMQKTTTAATVVVTLSANAGASSFSNVGFGAIYQPAAAATNSIVSGTGPTLALTSPSLATAAGYYYHIYKAFVQTGSIAPKVIINLTSTSGTTTPQVGSHRKLVKIA